MSSLRQWIRGLVTLPAAIMPILPGATCPVCMAAYAGALSALGLGINFNARVQPLLISGFLAIAVASVAWSTRNHGRVGPIVAALLGSATILTGRLIWSIPAVVYCGVALLLGASIWNLWLKRPRSERLVQLQLGTTETTACPSCDVGIAIGAGTDVAIESAGVILVSDRLEDVLGALTLGKGSYRTMTGNVIVAVLFNIWRKYSDRSSKSPCEKRGS